uniref:MBT domain-containing 1-like n=1 Tax=Elaeophora elaphi TaxID=1147741 RepID=A0A0R3RR41_9BILA
MGVTLCHASIRIQNSDRSQCRNKKDNTTDTMSSTPLQMTAVYGEAPAGIDGTRRQSTIEIPSRSVIITAYSDTMKHCQNYETVKDNTVDGAARSKDSKTHEQSSQRTCSESSNVQISNNQSWEEARMQKSVHQPFSSRKIKRKRKMLDSMKDVHECLKSPLEEETETLFSVKLSRAVVQFAVVLNAWADVRCELCNVRITSFNLIKKQTKWCSKTCKALKFLQQDGFITTAKAFSTFATSSSNSSEEIVLTDVNIQGGILAEKLMNEESGNNVLSTPIYSTNRELGKLDYFPDQQHFFNINLPVGERSMLRM